MALKKRDTGEVITFGDGGSAVSSKRGSGWNANDQAFYGNNLTFRKVAQKGVVVTAKKDEDERKKRLEELRKQYVVGDISPENKAILQQIREAADIKPNWVQRALLTGGAAGKNYAGTVQNTGGFFLETMGRLNDAAFEAEYADQIRAAKNSHDYWSKVLAETQDEQERQRAQSALDIADNTLKNFAELKEMQSRDVDTAAGQIYEKADKKTGDAERMVEKAKDGAGNVGQFLVDVGYGGAQLAADVGAGIATGGGALVPMAVRTFGAGTQEARQAGASYEQQLGYGAASAALSVGTERLVSLASPLSKAFGGGVADDVVKKLAGKMYSSAAGRTVLNALGEGGEEMLEAVADPLLKKIYDSNAGYDSETISNVLYSGLLGAVLGGGMGAVGEVGDAKNAKAMYAGSEQELVDKALELDENSRTARAASKRLEQGKALSGATLNNLVRQNESAILRRGDRIETEETEADKVQRLVDALSGDKATENERDSAAEALLGYEVSEEETEARRKRAAEAKRTAVSPIAHNAEFTEEEARHIVEEGAKEFGNAASSVVNSYMSGQDPQMYMAQAKLVFNYGKTMSEEKGIPYALKSPLLKSMDETQIRSVFNAGRMQAKAIPVTAVKGKGEVVLTDGIDYSLLDPVRRKQVTALSSFAKATGYTIELFESKADKDGRYTAELGSFDHATGVIRIDINAGRNKVDDLTHYAMVRVASHEITHSFKKNAPQQYVALRDYVTGVLSDKGEFDDLVDAKMSDLGLDHEAAVDEVVADGCEMMLRDTRFAEQLAKENRTLFEKIRDAIRKFVKKIRDAFEGVEIAHEEAALLKDAENLQKLWDEALARSVENVAAAEEVIRSGAKPIPDGEIVTDGAVVVGENGKLFSIRSMKADIAEGKMFEDLKKYCGWSQARVNELRRQLTDLVAYMEPHRDILDMNESYGREGRKFSPYKPNSDPLYQISMDFSTLCSKRLLTQYVIENLQLRENRPMSAEEQMAIRDMLIEYRQVEKGLQVACAMCYVEAARLKSPKQMQRWLDDPAPLLRDYFGKANKAFNDSVKEAQADFKESRGYARNAPKKEMSAADVRELNKIGPRMRAQYQLSEEEMQIVERAKSLPNSTYLTAANLAKLSETDPVIYHAYTSFVRTATRSKSLETDEPYYYGDSTRDNGNGIIVSDSFIEAVNRENGMRFSSWSDWRIQHLLDYIAAVIDNSVRGAAMHGYTKFAEEVRVLGKTGMMFNLSGVTGTQTGLNPDGSLNFSPTESIDINDAVELRKEFPETAGLQCIGVSDDHIFALLRSDIIDYVIPYHVSGLNKGLRRMADIHGWKDYTSTQHAAVDSSVKNNGQEHWHEEPVFSEFFVGYDTGMTGEEAMQESARRYVEMCRERGLTPKFEKFVNEPGYWKLLVDRKMINQKTGKLIQQKPVTPTFDFEAIKGVVDRYVENYDSGLESRALDYIVKNWDSVPGRIRTLKKSGVKKTKSQQALDTLYNEMMAAQPTETQYSKREGVEQEDGVSYSFRTGYIPTDRSILAAYVPTDSDSDMVKKHIAEYQQNVKELKAMQLKRGQMVHDLEALADNNSPKSKAEKKRLREEIVKTDGLIQGLLDQLSRKERWYGVKEVLQKEKTEIMRKAKAEKNEQLKKYRARREDTESRRKLRERITYRVKTLDKMLRNPTDDKHIPEDLRDLIFAFCEPFTYNPGVFKGKALKRAEVEYYFEGEGKGEVVFDQAKIESLIAKYSALKGKGENNPIADLYDGNIEEMLDLLKTTISGKPLSKLSLGELDVIKDIADHFAFIVKAENEIFVHGRKVKLDETAQGVIAAAKEHKRPAPEIAKGETLDAFEKFLTSGNLRPVYFFRDKGSDMDGLFQSLLDAQSEYAFRMEAAMQFVEETEKATGYSEWGNSEETLTLTNSANQQVTLNLQQAMSLLATYERELQSGNLFHVTQGGFLYEKDVTGDITVKGVKVPVIKQVVQAEKAKAHPMSAEDMDKVRTWLGEIDPRVLDYMGKMVEYLSTTMADYGNETSMQLHGYKKFGEGYYWPIKSAEEFLQQEPGKAGFDESRWKHKGFTKATVKGANNPFVLRGFVEVWSNHVSQMCMYSTMAVPQDAFVRVMNYKTKVDPTGSTASESVKSEIRSNYGQKALAYIGTYLNDINGGLLTDPRAGALNRLVSLFKKNAVFGSASVALQQYSAVIRATVYLDPKYFVRNAGWKKTQDAFERAKRYSGVAIIKEIGGFDTTTGRSGANWLMERDPAELKGKARALIQFGEKDTGYRDRLLTALPAKMDKVGWGHIWIAAENEIADTTDLERGTDAFYEAVAKRFEEVIELTQVYDSVLTRSENMRGKDGLIKAATSFMAEPTVTMNMFVTAAQDAIAGKDGAKARLAKTAFVLAMSVVVNNILKALATAGRDKDEDQTIAEKYVEDVVGGIISDVNPLGYVPILRDIKSIWEGYSVEASYAAVISDVYDAWKKWEKNQTVESGFDVLNAVAALFGIPAKNLKRDIMAVLDTFLETAPLSESSKRGFWNATREGLGIMPGVDDKMMEAFEADRKGNEKARKKALDEITRLYEDKAKQYRLEGKEEPAKKAKSSLKSTITSVLKPLYQAAKTQTEKNRIKSLALRVYVGGEQLYNGYDFERYWGED